MVNIYIGAERAKWHLHEDLLCNTSPFFRCALKGSFAEASKRSIELPEDDVDSFDLFVRWLYGGDKFPLSSPDGEDVLYDYLKLYVLASKLLTTRLQNKVINAVFFYVRQDRAPLPALQHVQYIYENTEAGSKMRALLSECIAAHLFSGRLEQPFPEEWERILQSSGGVGCDIIRYIYCWNRSVSLYLSKSPCKFHDHEDGSS
jgi:hypothetical protein